MNGRIGTVGLGMVPGDQEVRWPLVSDSMYPRVAPVAIEGKVQVPSIMSEGVEFLRSRANTLSGRMEVGSACFHVVVPHHQVLSRLSPTVSLST